ncbi:MAG: excinuclease ABC subunit UvrA, partial [Patescibacteria group bacterium]|nr:excinuclease ABC subunit UvrA [Patescibacteria group bacterium]
CEVCHGTRYNKEALEITYRDKHIAEVLKMPAEEALKFFQHVPALKQKLSTLTQVGLGYMELGQPAPSLSGGEAQHVKLANELAKRATGKTMYILDEPTTGLHPDDIVKLLGVLRALVERGNTVLVIEHNLDVLANADWIVDLGPEGGDAGGEVVAQGTPEIIMKTKGSYTGEYLRKFKS